MSRNPLPGVMQQELPDGWFYQVNLVDPKLVHITWPDHGHVTVHLGDRRFAIGHVTWVNPRASRPVKGLRWRHELVAAAVASLKETFKDEEND